MNLSHVRMVSLAGTYPSRGSYSVRTGLEVRPKALVLRGGSVRMVTPLEETVVRSPAPFVHTTVVYTVVP